jgi:uncharacterized protein (TIGR02246 family)
MGSWSQRLVLVIAFLSSSVAGLGQNPSADEAAIRSIVQGSEDAWNRGDAQAFAAHYSESGEFTNVIGQQLYGREAFIAQHAKIFSTIYKGSRNVFSVTKITFLRPDVALVDIDGTLSGALQIPPGVKAFDDGTVHVKLLEVMTREKGSWSIAAFHNVAVFPLPPSGPPK